MALKGAVKQVTPPPPPKEFTVTLTGTDEDFSALRTYQVEARGWNYINPADMAARKLADILIEAR